MEETMGKTRIEWTQHTWNPVTGCSKVSPGCKNCYAERRARMLAGRAGYPAAPHHFDVTLRPERLNIPLKRKKPTTYFLPSMGDLFHKDVPGDFIRAVFDTILQTPRHTYQILTKNPKLMATFFRLFSSSYGKLLNVHLGVSIETPEYSYRSQYLRETPTTVRFISFEPLLASFADCPGVFDDMDWIIVGGESGPGARPMHPDWVRRIRDQCVSTDKDFFFKQWGAWLHSSQTTATQRNEMHHKLKRYSSYKWPDGSYSWRIGKKYAGRLLDGRTWDEMPQ